MQKDDQGVWNVTVGPLEPDFYGYAFVADGGSLVLAMKAAVDLARSNPRPAST